MGRSGPAGPGRGGRPALPARGPGEWKTCADQGRGAPHLPLKTKAFCGSRWRGARSRARSGSGSLGSAGRYALTTAGEGRVEFERALFRDGVGQPLQGLTLVGGTLRVTAN